MFKAIRWNILMNAKFEITSFHEKYCQFHEAKNHISKISCNYMKDIIFRKSHHMNFMQSENSQNSQNHSLYYSFRQNLQNHYSSKCHKCRKIASHNCFLYSWLTSSEDVEAYLDGLDNHWLQYDFQYNFI